jgi:hypothetical protein
VIFGILTIRGEQFVIGAVTSNYANEDIITTKTLSENHSKLEKTPKNAESLNEAMDSEDFNDECWRIFLENENDLQPYLDDIITKTAVLTNKAEYQSSRSLNDDDAVSNVDNVTNMDCDESIITKFDGVFDHNSLQSKLKIPASKFQQNKTPYSKKISSKVLKSDAIIQSEVNSHRENVLSKNNSINQIKESEKVFIEESVELVSISVTANNQSSVEVNSHNQNVLKTISTNGNEIKPNEVAYLENQRELQLYFDKNNQLPVELNSHSEKVSLKHMAIKRSENQEDFIGKKCKVFNHEVTNQSSVEVRSNIEKVLFQSISNAIEESEKQVLIEKQDKPEILNEIQGIFIQFIH